MPGELEKLRISKDKKARRDDGSAWPKVLLVVVVIGVAAALWSWRSIFAATAVQTMRVRIDQPAAGENNRVALDATGYIIAAHKIELASKVIGRVAWVGVEMGDKIKKGQELVRLEDDEYRARVAQQEGLLDNAKARLAELEAGSRVEEIGQAKADVDQAQAQLTNARLNYDRLRQLGDTSTVAQKEVDDALTLTQSRAAELESRRQQYELIKAGPRKEQIAAQRATVRQLEGSMTLATVDLQNTIIRSPVDATVLARNVEIGEFVTNGFVGDRGAKGYVVSIADLNDLQVELDVSQSNFAKVSAKQPCWIVTDTYPDHRYDGRVELISPEANRQKATVQVRVKVLSPDALLKPDMNATVSFLTTDTPATQSGEPAAAPSRMVRVPAGAVRDGAVFIVQNGKAVKRPVTTGQSADGQTEIRSGLIGGEDLIVSPPAELRDGETVKIQPANP